ncbi:MAG: hypothetical protein ACLFUZ_00575 [Candidatus Micrarchaeia archaeon]
MEAEKILVASVALFTGLLILVLFVYFFSYPAPSLDFSPTSLDLGASGYECNPGDELPCEDERGCPGSRICLHGEWSSCTVREECTPGETRFCPTGGCSNGIQVCDSCSHWGPCLPSGCSSG